jgi:phosphopantetheinyl transferase
MPNTTLSVYWADLLSDHHVTADLNCPNVPIRPYRTTHLQRLSMLSKRLLNHALQVLPPHPDEPLVGLRYHQDGKPYLSSSRYSFSLSHSGQLAACVVTGRGPVGVDIQQRTPLRPGIEGLFLTKAERACVAGEDVLALWSQKEAAFKAFGHELNARLTDFHFDQIQQLRCGSRLIRLVPLSIQPDYIGYVAYEFDSQPVTVEIEYV